MWKFCRSVLALWISSVGFSPVMYSVESSAKRIVLKFVNILVMSFMYKRKRIGPRTLPCGTPYSMCSGGDRVLRYLVD